MNKKGFTLAELIAVIVLIALISLIVFPTINNIEKNGNIKKYSAYKDLMIEYAKLVPKEKYKKNGTIICYKDLEIKPINDNTTCNGYVDVSNKKYISYLECKTNGEIVYRDDVDIDILNDCN